jgi:ssDNA-binding Zn-finger/Zn-ribbon topoisomerase 1
MAVQRRAFYSQREMLNDPQCYNSRQDYSCPECGAEMEIIDSGKFRGVDWENLECPECGYEVNEEPDLDFIYAHEEM